jgi:hypothetical protein
MTKTMQGNQQIGDYVIEVLAPDLHTERGWWGVRMAGATEYLSHHKTDREAKAAIRRYQKADQRRTRGT